MATSLRPIWTGQIRLSLVSLPVKLYAASSSTPRVSLHQIHGPSGQRIRYEKVAPGVGAADPGDIQRAYEYQKGHYVVLEDEEISGLKVGAKKTIDLVQFIEEEEIDPRYFDTPYFAAPDGKLAEDAYRVVREGLQRSGKVGLGQLALRGRAHPVAVKALGKGLLVETLRYADELRAPELAFEGIVDAPADPELVDLALELIARKTAPFEPQRFTDEYAEALERLVQKKLAAQDGAIIVEERERAPERGGAVIDLVEALKRSLTEDPKPANDRGEEPAKPAPKRSRSKTDREPVRRKRVSG